MSDDLNDIVWERIKNSFKTIGEQTEIFIQKEMDEKGYTREQLLNGEVILEISDQKIERDGFECSFSQGVRLRFDYKQAVINLIKTMPEKSLERLYLYLTGRITIPAAGFAPMGMKEDK